MTKGLRHKKSAKIKLAIFDLDDTLFDTTGTLDATYKNLPYIALFPGMKHLLKHMHCPKTLVTKGGPDLQNKKIDILGIRTYFDSIVITASDEEKLSAFKDLISKFKISDPTDVLIVGNRIDSEIRYGNMLGCTTVFIKHGRHSHREPKDTFEIADSTIEDIAKVSTDIATYF